MDTNKMNSNWLEELKSKCDIISVISKYIKLEKKGKNFWACCPFHHEKTPSFYVNEYEQYFHCFGCKEGGDVISFVQKYEMCDFMTAVSKLAESVGMVVPNNTSDNIEYNRIKKEKDKSMQILNETCKYYVGNLKQNSSSPAYQYLVHRKISPEFAEKFLIGYSKDWTGLVSHLTSFGYTTEEMKIAGVVDEKNDKIYDAMAGRLTFPIIDSSEQCLGFSARILDKSDFAKYKNTAQTLLFNKSKILLGINFLKQLKQKGLLKQIIIVEGQIDVITMHQNGFNSAVACMGTALTREHARELKRFCLDIVLCFDGDNAGRKATINSIITLREFEFNIKIVCLPDKYDPDEYLKQYGVDGMKKLFENAMSEIEYLLYAESRKYDMQKNDEKSKYINKALTILNSLPTFSQKQVFLPIIRKYSNVPVDVLMRDLTSLEGKDPSKVVDVPKQSDDRENANVKATKFVLASILFGKDYVDYNIDYSKFIRNQSLKELYDLIKAYQEKNKKLTVSDVYNHFDVDNNNLIKEIVYYNFDEIGNNANQYFDACVWNFYENYLKTELDRLNLLFKQTDDVSERRTIADKINIIVKKLKNKQVEEEI